MLESILCILFGHDYETVTDKEFMIGAGPVNVKRKECKRCSRKKIPQIYNTKK